MSDAVTSVVHPGLWLVATPIGNLEDIAPRAGHVLRTAHTIFCEDTRHSQALLRAYGIDHPGSHWLAVRQPRHTVQPRPAQRHKPRRPSTTNANAATPAIHGRCLTYSAPATALSAAANGLTRWAP